ncbi:MAG: aminotransferase class V-fold PLP-dependent enzyme, partial [Vicinamibacterales bacterium]
MAQATDVRTFREEFPVSEEWSYLNHAAYGPFPTRTVRAVTGWAEGFANAPTFFGEHREKIPGETAGYVAGLAGTTAEMVAWVPSLADGMNLLAHGVDWREGDNVLIPVDEFPSVVYPFLNLRSRGVETRFVAKNDEGRTDLNLIEAAIDERTRAVAISHVEYMDGFRNDLLALGALCRSRDVELFVDVTQALGAQPIDLTETGVSAVAAHGYKWLMAGFGIGCVVFNVDAIERIRVTYAGRLSVKAGFEDADYRLDWRDGAARYQTGGLNQLGLTAMHASLSLVSRAGPEWTREHTLGLLDRLAEGVQQMGYAVASDLTREHRSQIMAFT